MLAPAGSTFPRGSGNGCSGDCRLPGLKDGGGEWCGGVWSEPDDSEGGEERRAACTRQREQAEAASSRALHGPRRGLWDLSLVPLSQSPGPRLLWGLAEAGMVLVMEILPQRASGLRLEPCLEPGSALPPPPPLPSSLLYPSLTWTSVLFAEPGVPAEDAWTHLLQCQAGWLRRTGPGCWGSTCIHTTNI